MFSWWRKLEDRKRPAQEDAICTTVLEAISAMKPFASSSSLKQCGGLDIVVCNTGRQQSIASILGVSTADFDVTYDDRCALKAQSPLPDKGESIRTMSAIGTKRTS
ncbi:MAG: hypothetical protein WAN27_04295 [Xanthobacteraceae bacterium]|jgi:hypothetical protein